MLADKKFPALARRDVRDAPALLRQHLAPAALSSLSARSSSLFSSRPELFAEPDGSWCSGWAQITALRSRWRQTDKCLQQEGGEGTQGGGGVKPPAGWTLSVFCKLNTLTVSRRGLSADVFWVLSTCEQECTWNKLLLSQVNLVWPVVTTVQCSSTCCGTSTVHESTTQCSVSMSCLYFKRSSSSPFSWYFDIMRLRPRLTRGHMTSYWRQWCNVLWCSQHCCYCLVQYMVRDDFCLNALLSWYHTVSKEVRK